MIKNSTLGYITAIAFCFSSILYAKGNSELSANASIVGIIGSAVAGSAVITAGEWIVTRVKPTQNKVNVTMHSPTQGKNTTLAIPAKQIAKTPVVRGQKVQVKAVNTGYLIKTKNNTLGFIPNAKGQSILHSNAYH